MASRRKLISMMSIFVLAGGLSLADGVSKVISAPLESFLKIPSSSQTVIIPPKVRVGETIEITYQYQKVRNCPSNAWVHIADNRGVPVPGMRFKFQGGVGDLDEEVVNHTFAFEVPELEPGDYTYRVQMEPTGTCDGEAMIALPDGHFKVIS